MSNSKSNTPNNFDTPVITKHQAVMYCSPVSNMMNSDLRRKGLCSPISLDDHLSTQPKRPTGESLLSSQTNVIKLPEKSPDPSTDTPYIGPGLRPVLDIMYSPKFLDKLSVTGSKDDQWNKCPSITGFFSYNPNSPCGPQHWHKKYPLCGGDKQSPINIQTGKTERANINRVYYRRSKTVDGIFENNGFAPNFEVHGHPKTNILIVGREDDDDDGTSYVFKEFHYHIGSNESSYGSEHVVNMKGYKGEVKIIIHLVHERKTFTGDDGGKTGGQDVLVVGVFFNVVEKCGSYADKMISKFITKIPNYLDETEAYVKPKRLLPKDGKFYTYIGSKTTPVCTPDYLWIVFKTPTTVCRKNFEVLMNLETWEANNPPLSKFGNNRPIQRFDVNNVKTNFRKTKRHIRSYLIP
ncbi:carbonic anhydrase 2-like [Ylistrum balloti]|uniref:carbonic anhydrase 2-like n=1 Tax=Ylistrum balloti TaxID=509963 RepID=UPI002905A7A2|nr:carbonic anhydrase 2-like [Ylistrum balloti]